MKINPDLIDNGQILWENPDLTQYFTAQNVTLNSSDYDVLEIFYYNWLTEPKIMSSKYLKGKDGTMMCPILYNSKAYVGVRNFTYSSDTSLSFDGGYSFLTNSTISVLPANDWVIPVCIVGYRTGIF